MRKIFQDKKGVSLMISYVLLVVIAIVMSIVVFTYLRFVANVEPVIDCEEGTSIIIEDYVCDPDNNKITLTMRNNGRFSVTGFTSAFGGNSLQEPTTKLLTIDSGRLSTSDGSYIFEEPLKPGELIDTNFGIQEVKADGKFGDVIFSFLKKIKIQPYIYDDEADLNVPCTNAIIKQDIQDCQIKEFDLLKRPIAQYTFPSSVPLESDPNFETALKAFLDDEGISTPVPTPSIHYEFENNLDSRIGNGDLRGPFPSEATVKYIEGYLGNSVDFDGSYDIRGTGTQINNKLNGQFFSVAFWMKKSSDTSNPLVKKRNSNKGFELKLIDSKINALGDSEVNQINCDIELPNQWSYVTVTYLRTVQDQEGFIKIYIDGEFCSEIPSGLNTLKAPGTPLIIGNKEFLGQLDEFKIWKLELTKEEVSSLYSNYIN